MKTIDLGEIIKRYETFVTISQPHNTEPIFLKENVKELCIEFGEELLKLAAENSEVADQQSILDTIKQVKL